MASTKVDVIELIDRHPVTGFQIGVLILCMLVAALDGFDTQAIGYTAPAIAGVLKSPMSQFGQVGSIGLLGAALGALSFGPFADVFGRKWFMIVAIVVFAVFSLLTAHSASFEQLLGLSLPRRPRPWRRDPCLSRHGRRTCSEAPARRVRHRVVCVLSRRRPHRFADECLGDPDVRMASGVLHRHGRAAHRRGHPCNLAARIVRFLLARNIRQDEVRRTLSRIMPGQIPPGAELITTPDPARQGMPVLHLFTEGRAIPTVLLWVPFFMAFMVLLTVTFWTPSVLNSVGFSLSAAALIVGLNNFGSVCASAMSGWLVHRFGAYRMLIPGFIIGGLCLAWFGQATSSVFALSIASLLAGFFVGGTGTGLIALAAGMYPTSDPLDRHRLGHGHGPRRTIFRAVPHRSPGSARLESRRHLLCRRGAVLHRRVVLVLPVVLASDHGARRIRKSCARRIAADQASSNLRRGTHASAHFASYWCRISARRHACARIHSGERYARTARLTGSNSRELDSCITCTRLNRRARRLPAGTGPSRRKRPLVLSHRSCDQPQVLVPLAIRSGSSAGSRRSTRPAESAIGYPFRCGRVRRTSMSQAASPKRSARRCSTSSCCGRNGRSLELTAPQELRREIERSQERPRDRSRAFEPRTTFRRTCNSARGEKCARSHRR